MRLKLVSAVFFLAAAVHVSSQTNAEAVRSVWQVDVGAGVSGFNDSYCAPCNTGVSPGNMEGAAIWAEVYPNLGPRLVHGFGLAIEARDISFGRPSTQPSNLREDTGGGGVIYQWRHFHNLTPYGKFLWEQGSVDFIQAPGYNHDDRTLHAFGGGLDYRVWRQVSVRADYEEQIWQYLFENHQLSFANGLQLKPRGFTVGAVYQFDHIHFH